MDRPHHARQMFGQGLERATPALLHARMHRGEGFGFRWRGHNGLPKHRDLGLVALIHKGHSSQNFQRPIGHHGVASCSHDLVREAIHPNKSIGQRDLTDDPFAPHQPAVRLLHGVVKDSTSFKIQLAG